MFDRDELAGIVDCFGALSREELVRAASELAFRRGDDPDESAIETAVDDALEEYALVEHEGRFVAGPGAFPALPDGGEDLPHILDVEERAVDREAVAETITEQFRADAAAAVDRDDVERCRQLLDRTYDLESWGPVDLAEARTRLDDAMDRLERD